MTIRKLQIALNKQGNIVSIYDVNTGMDCNCLCPECKEPLVAKNKNKTGDETLNKGQKIAHFSHYDGSICASAPESAIHLLAKEVLKEHKKFLIPPIIHNENQLTEKKSLIFSSVELEKRLEIDSSYIIPDAIGYVRDKTLLIEFKHTHAVDNDKIEKIKKIGFSCIEINVNWIPPLIDGKLNIAAFKYLFEFDTYRKKWIFNAQTEKLYTEFLRNVELEKQAKDERTRRRYQKEEEKRIEKEKRHEKEIADLLSSGYQFISIEEFVHYNYNTYYNDHTGRSKTYKTFNSKDEYVFCPRIKVNDKNKRVDLIDCRFCEFHFSVRKEKNIFIKKVVCKYHP